VYLQDALIFIFVFVSLLGPGVHDLPLSASQALASTLRDTRVVVMDGNIGVFNTEDESTDGVSNNY
jgi:hypothetical protein